MPKLRPPTLCAALLLLSQLFLSPTTTAEVVDSESNGFTSRNQATVAALTTEVWASLVEDVGKWWNPAHTFSLDAGNMSIDATPQGCFCEDLPDGGGVRHLTVVAAIPGKMLRMTGGLGPLQGQAVSGVMTWEMEPKEGGGTKITTTLAVHGYTPQGLESWAEPVDRVVGEALERLARYVDTGNPEPAAPAAPGGEAPEAPDGDAAPGAQG